MPNATHRPHHLPPAASGSGASETRIRELHHEPRETSGESPAAESRTGHRAAADGQPARRAAGHDDPGPLPPAWGWPILDGGRAVYATAGPEFQGTTTQLCGLFPFVAGSGTPAVGTPVGRHQLWGEVVCLDPLAWLRAGLVTNPGMLVLGQPRTGKSALVKRLVTGAVACGTRVLILGDTKPDYTPLIRYPSAGK